MQINPLAVFTRLGPWFENLDLFTCLVSTYFSCLFFQGDFFAIELLDGYIYMHLDLGSGSLKLRASNRRLDDGTWHKVDVVRNRKRGNLQVSEALLWSFKLEIKEIH